MKSVVKDIFMLGRHHQDNPSQGRRASKFKSPGFSFKLYALVVFLLVATVVGINWLIDPLWYSHGNLITGKNFAFNERISKTNLFLRTKSKLNYDCVILGSSRAITLRASAFRNNQCFNYAIKGGEIEDFINYARFLKEEGVNPQKIYIGVDGLNFVVKKRIDNNSSDVGSLATKSFYHAYFSADVFLFSLMTLLGVSPDPANYYDSQFEPADFENPPVYKPDFYQPLSAQECDLSIVGRFAEIKNIFPEAELIGFVPPRSAWSIVNDTYGRNLTDCEIEAFYQLSQIYDAMYDFSIPSVVTQNPLYTHDGSHYSVEVNNEIAEILQGKPPSFGVRVDQYSYEEYRDLYLSRIREFLAQNGELARWR